MRGFERVSRREVLGGVSVATVSALAGCGGNPVGGGGDGGESMTWAEAFEAGVSSEDRAALEPTPVAVSAVDTRAEVETALTVLGWTLSVEEQGAPVADDLQTAADVASDLRPTLDRAIALLNDGLALVADMKETSAFGTSVWDVAVASAPSLDQFDDLARALKGRLESQRRRLADLRDATTTVLEHVRSIRESGTTAYGSLGGDVDAARSLYQGVGADVDELRADVQQVIEIGLEGRDAAGELPLMSREVASVFDGIVGAARELDDRLAAFRQSVSVLTDGLAGLVDGAASEANERYGPISEDATGSAGELSVASVRTDVQAYGASGADAGGSDGGDADSDPGDDGADTGHDGSGPTVTEPPGEPSEYVTMGGRSDRGSFQFTVPTRVPAGVPFTVEGRVTEASTEQYGGFTVEVDGEQVASIGLQAGESEQVAFTREYQEPGERELLLVVRFTNSDHGVNEVVDHVTFDVRVVG